MNGTRSTLLIVDDEPSCREAFRMALEDEYRLIEADSGKAALNTLRSGQNIDLMLLDYFLPPGINGLNIIERMNKLECNIPVILVTGKGSEEVAVNAFRLGVKDYIIKPFRIRELQATIRATLHPVKKERSVVEEVVHFMDEHYDQISSAKEIAATFNVSYVHLANLFKNEKGCSILNYLITLRINRAKRLLQDTHLEIKEVAVKVGFNNQNYFCRLFKRIAGKSPTEFRRQSATGDFSA